MADHWDDLVTCMRALCEDVAHMQKNETTEVYHTMEDMFIIADAAWNVLPHDENLKIARDLLGGRRPSCVLARVREALNRFLAPVV